MKTNQYIIGTWSIVATILLSILNGMCLFHSKEFELSLSQYNLLMLSYSVAFEVASIMIAIYYFRKRYIGPMILTILIAAMQAIQTGTMFYGINYYSLLDIIEPLRIIHYITISFGLVYSIFLTFGKARKEFWLLLYGVSIFIDSLIFLTFELFWKNDSIYEILFYVSSCTPLFLLITLNKNRKELGTVNLDLIDWN